MMARVQPRRWSEAVWIAVIGTLGVVLVAVVPAAVTIYTAKSAAQQASIADQKLDSIHTLTNSALTAATARGDAALARIAALEELLKKMTADQKP